jgi:hypothetical protein
MTEVCSRKSSLAERRPNPRPRRSSSWQAATPRGGQLAGLAPGGDVAAGGDDTDRSFVNARNQGHRGPAATAWEWDRHCSAARTTRWNVQSMPTASRNSPGLLVWSGDRHLLSIVMDRTIRLPNDQRAQRGNATRGAIHVVRLLPAILFLHLRELAVKVLQLISRAGIW